MKNRTTASFLRHANVVFLPEIKALVMLILTFGFASTIHASDCRVSEPCEAYSKAESVFIGELVEVDFESDDFKFEAKFKVKRVFKGGPAPIQAAVFRKSNFERAFVVGETYFVYQNQSSRWLWENFTHLFDEKSCHYQYAKSLSKEKPKFIIGGVVYDGLNNRVKNAKVEIVFSGSARNIRVSKTGKFVFYATERVRYRLRITVPFAADAFVTQGRAAVDLTPNVNKRETIIEYDLEFSDNSCDFRNIRIIRRE